MGPTRGNDGIARSNVAAVIMIIMIIMMIMIIMIMIIIKATFLLI
jgi:hypothetical protein